MTHASLVDLSLLALLAVAVVDIAIGAFVFSTKPGDKARQYFGAFATATGMWVLGFFLLMVTRDFVFDRVVHFFGNTLVLFLALFAQHFPKHTPLPIPWYIAYGPLLVGLLLIVPSGGIVTSISFDEAGMLVPQVGPLLPLWSVILLAYIIFAFVLFIRSYRSVQGQERLRLGYVFVGMGISVIAAFVFDAFLPAFFDITAFHLLGPGATLAFVILTAYAIVRHQLMDIRIIIKRGFVYSVLLGCVVGFYIALLQLFRYAFHIEGEISTLISAILTTLLGIFTAPHIERFFRKITDRIFFKDVYDYADALHSLSSVLHANISFGDLVRESERALYDILRPAFVQISFGRTRTRSSQEPVALQVPITLDGAEIGCIHLGQKRSGDSYTPQDIRLLETFAYQAATALSRAQLYAEAQDQAALLERKVSERTRELSMARAREQQMLNDISHNLQTPLTILQTRLDAVKPLLSDDREVHTLEQSLARFSSFIYDLLSFARIENSPLSTTNQVDISALMQDLTEEIGVIADANNIELETSIAPDVVITGDTRRMREALMNVASNAVKYLPEIGTRRITFTLSRTEHEATIIITDTGIGIAESDLPYIFDRFYRGKENPNETRGTGLGLAITKRIVEQHAGSIGAESTVNKGTTITITFPL